MVENNYTNLEHIWTKVITAEDIDTHMQRSGFAQGICDLVTLAVKDAPLKDNSSLLIAGAGTGQLFDYMHPSDFGNNIKFHLTDINDLYLRKASKRLESLVYKNTSDPVDFRASIDNITETSLKKGDYSNILITLVLQHVDWKKAIDNMTSLDPEGIYIVVQGNKEQLTNTQVKTMPPPSLIEASSIAHPVLVNSDDLIHYLKGKSFNMTNSYKQETISGKELKGLVFKK